MANVILMDLARRDLADAVKWYSEQSLHTAEQFLAEYERMEDLVAENPGRWPLLEPGIRKLVFRRFPYSLIYTVGGEHVFVIAVKHHSRTPGYWRR